MTRAGSKGAGRIRVAFVSDSEPERNGVGAYYADLIAQLDRDQFESVFLCPGDGGSLGRGGLHLPLPGDSTQQIWLPSTRAFGRAMRALAPDVVVVATPGPYGLLGVRWARKLSARLIVGFHTDYTGVTDLYSRSIFRIFSRGYFRFADRMLFRNADHVLGNSGEMIELAERLGARSVSRIGTLLPTTVLEAPCRPLGASFDRVLFAGRLAPEKRLHAVIDAARALPDLRFEMAGEGPLRGQVERAAGELDNLQYRGWLTRAQLLERMDACDALVLPSELESFGTVALEAMARGRLAVVTSTCGIVNWPGLAEHLVSFSIDEDLSSVLERVRDWPAGRRQAMARSAREAAQALNAETLDQWNALLRGAG